MSEKLQESEHKSYLLTLNENELKNFIKKLNDKINLFDKNITIKDFFNIEDIEIKKIIKKDKLNWLKTRFYIDENIDKTCENETNYRIVLYKYSIDTYYFEKSGGFNIEDILKDIDKVDFTKEIWNNIKVSLNNKGTKLLKEKIEKFFFTNIKDVTNKILKDNNITNNYVLNEDYTYDNIINYYNDLIKNKQVIDEQKLMKYDSNQCISNDKNSETLYNKKVSESNEKYILLDTKLQDSCEIADIFDTENNLLFHNKKNKDLRVLSSQILNGILIIKNDTKCKEFCKKHKLEKEQIEKSIYVFGIIREKKDESIKDKLAIGTCCYLLKQISVDYKCDIIEYIPTDKNNNNKVTDENKTKIKKTRNKCIKKTI